MTPLQEYEHFRDHNQKHRIIEGAWLDEIGRIANGSPKTWAHLRYRFEDGSEVKLTGDAVAISNARSFKPRWKH